MIQTTVKKQGFEGILFYGNGTKDKVVIVISGSNGGMKLTRQCAQFYDQNGIPALAVALFATKGTQPYLDCVPVEYIESAIRWLKKQGYQRIGIDGMSKGSEIALIAASMFTDLSCVIVRVPSYFVSEGLTGKMKHKAPSGTSCWSYQQKELPYSAYKTRKFNILKMLFQQHEMCILPYNLDKDIIPESIIPITKIQAPILMLSSKHDTIWPSYQSALYMEQLLKQKEFSYPYKHIAYNTLSHMLVTRIPLFYKFAFKSERNNIRECKKEREQLKYDLLDWIHHI